MRVSGRGSNGVFTLRRYKQCQDPLKISFFKQEKPKRTLRDSLKMIHGSEMGFTLQSQSSLENLKIWTEVPVSDSSGLGFGFWCVKEVA